MLTRKLLLDGRSKRLWHAEVSGTNLRIATGAASKAPVFKEKAHGYVDAAIHALRKAQLAKLRAGYVLDGPHGALVALLGLEAHSHVSLSPDGTRIWQAIGMNGKASFSVRSLATGEVIFERELDSSFQGVHDIHACSATEALISTMRGVVVRVDLEGACEQWSDTYGAYRLDGAGDRILQLTSSQGAILFDARDARIIARVADANAAALSADGTMMVACREKSSSIEILDASDGSERARLSLGHGQGVRALAIGAEHVVAAGIWFPGSARQSTWAWSLADGARVATERFGDADDSLHGDAVLGASGALVALLGAGGGVLEIYGWKDPKPKLLSYELGRTTKVSRLRASSDGRWLLGFDGSGVVAVWDFARILEGHGENEFLSWSAEDREVKEDKPRKELLPAIKEAATEPDGDCMFTVDLGNVPSFAGAAGNGALYTSFSSEVTTFVDYSAWPPRTVRRAGSTISCVRSARGVWLVPDGKGLWITDDFSEQGDRLEPPFEAEHVGWLGEAPVIFDRNGEATPQVFVAGAWVPITGLVKADAPGGTGTIRLADGTSILTFRGAAYRIDESHRAHLLFEGKPGLGGDAVAMADGRVAYDGGLCVWIDGPGRKNMSLATGSKKHGITLLTAGPPGRLLLTFSSGGGPNRTNLAGSILALAGRATLLDKALFGVEPKTVLNELFTCGGRIVARVEFGNTFRSVDVAKVDAVARKVRFEPNT